MKNSKLKFLYWLPVLVLIVGISILSPVAHIINKEHIDNVHQLARLNAVTYSQQMVMKLEKAGAITSATEQIIVSEKGELNNFETVAENLMTDDIQSIQLAPNGIVDRIFPTEGNQTGMIDLINDPERGEISRYARDHNETVVQGPFTLKQGGLGLAIRNPVYLPDEDSPGQSERFWGFTIAIIKVPEIFEDSINSLTNFGYDYILFSKSKITQSDDEVVLSTKSSLNSPETYSFVFGGNEWTLAVMPTKGWNNGNNTIIVVITGIILIVLISFTSLLTVFLRQKSREYKTLASKDPLTGLLNRAGGTQAVKEYLKKHPDETCVGAVLDIDNFKVINDLYGHASGDVVLKYLADELRKAFPSDAIISRSGGDEFNIVLENATNDSVAEKLKEFTSAERVFTSCGGDVQTFTTSIGYAEYPKQTDDVSRLIELGDIALYEAKLRGRRCCMAFENDFLERRRFELGFALKDISENLPSAFLIYRAELNDDTMLFANNEMIKLTGCKDLDDFMNFCDRKFSNLIHPDERKKVENSIWKQINSQSDGSNDYVKYRLATKSGEYKCVYDHGRIVDNANYGKVFYVLIIDSRFIESHFE